MLDSLKKAFSWKKNPVQTQDAGLSPEPIPDPPQDPIILLDPDKKPPKKQMPFGWM